MVQPFAASWAAQNGARDPSGGRGVAGLRYVRVRGRGARAKASLLLSTVRPFSRIRNSDVSALATCGRSSPWTSKSARRSTFPIRMASPCLGPSRASENQPTRLRLTSKANRSDGISRPSDTTQVTRVTINDLVHPVLG